MGFLDSLGKGVTVDSSKINTGWVQHPCGSFKGTVTKIEFKTLKNDTDQNVIELYIKTAYGLTNSTEWCFKQSVFDRHAQNYAKFGEDYANQQPESALINTVIAKHKTYFVKLGFWTAEEAENGGWEDCLSFWNAVSGKEYNIVVKPNPRKPGSTQTFVNPLRKNQVDSVESDSYSAPARSFSSPQQGSYEQSNVGVSNRKPPGSDVNQDDIPF